MAESVLDNLMRTVGVPALHAHLGHVGLDGGIDAYLPNGELAGHFDAILGPERTEEVPDNEGRILKHVREVTMARQKALPFWEDRPNITWTFAVGRVEYAIDSIVCLTAGSVVLGLVRRGVLEASRPGYRAKG